jgi:hypothetical protein
VAGLAMESWGIECLLQAGSERHYAQARVRRQALLSHIPSTYQHSRYNRECREGRHE